MIYKIPNNFLNFSEFFYEIAEMLMIYVSYKPTINFDGLIYMV